MEKQISRLSGACLPERGLSSIRPSGLVLRTRRETSVLFLPCVLFFTACVSAMNGFVCVTTRLLKVAWTDSERDNKSVLHLDRSTYHLFLRKPPATSSNSIASFLPKLREHTPAQKQKRTSSQKPTIQSQSPRPGKTRVSRALAVNKVNNQLECCLKASTVHFFLHSFQVLGGTYNLIQVQFSQVP